MRTRAPGSCTLEKQEPEQERPPGQPVAFHDYMTMACPGTGAPREQETPLLLRAGAAPPPEPLLTSPEALSCGEQLTDFTRRTHQGDQSRWRKAQGQGSILFYFSKLKKKKKLTFFLVINVIILTLCKAKLRKHIKL